MIKPVSKILVTIRLLGDDLDPERVSKELRLLPSESHRKGQEEVTSTGQKFTRKTGYWAIWPDATSLLLSDHISQLASKIRGHRGRLDEVSGVQDSYLDVFIATHADEEGGGDVEFDLSREDLSALREIGLPVQFTIAVVRR